MKEKHGLAWSPSILADIAFLVLIFWIIFAFASPPRDSESWRAASEVAPENHAIKLVVTKDGNLFIDGKMVSVSESLWVYNLIMNKLETNPTQSVLLTTEQGVVAADVVKALDILRTVERDLRATSPDYQLALSVNAVASN